MGKRGRRASSTYTISKWQHNGQVTHWRVFLPVFDSNYNPIPGRRIRRYFDISLPRQQVEKIAKRLYQEALDNAGCDSMPVVRGAIAALLEYHEGVTRGPMPKAARTAKMEWDSIRDFACWVFDRQEGRQESPSAPAALLGGRTVVIQDATMREYSRSYDIDVESVDRSAIRDFRDYLCRRMSATSVNMRLRHLRTIFNYLVDEGRLDRCPIHGKDMVPTERRTAGSRVPPAAERKRFYSPDELRRLILDLNEYDAEVGVFASLAYLTGARRSELLKLKPFMIDRVSGLLNLPAGKTTAHAVALFPALQGVFDEWLEAGGEWQHADGMFDKIVRRRVDVLGISIAQPLHGFRHTLVSTLRNLGVATDDIARWVGHATPGRANGIVTGIYDHSHIEVLKRVARQIPVPWL